MTDRSVITIIVLFILTIIYQIPWSANKILYFTADDLVKLLLEALHFPI
jgi:hypothetical protein